VAGFRSGAEQTEYANQGFWVVETPKVKASASMKQFWWES